MDVALGSAQVQLAGTCGHTMDGFRGDKSAAVGWTLEVHARLKRGDSHLDSAPWGG